MTRDEWFATEPRPEPPADEPTPWRPLDRTRDRGVVASPPRGPESLLGRLALPSAFGRDGAEVSTLVQPCGCVAYATPAHFELDRLRARRGSKHWNLGASDPQQWRLLFAAPCGAHTPEYLDHIDETLAVPPWLFWSDETPPRGGTDLDWFIHETRERVRRAYRARTAAPQPGAGTGAQED